MTTGTKQKRNFKTSCTRYENHITLVTCVEIERMKRMGEPMNCPLCFGFYDDMFHVYDSEHDVWLCPYTE